MHLVCVLCGSILEDQHANLYLSVSEKLLTYSTQTTTTDSMIFKNACACVLLDCELCDRMWIALLKAQVSLQLGNVSSSDNGVSLSIMYSYTYIGYC